MAIFSKNQRGAVAASRTERLIESVENIVNSSTITSKELASSALSLESINDSAMSALASATTEIHTALESIANSLGMAPAERFTQAQFDAATAAGILAGNPRAFFSNVLTPSMESRADFRNIMPSGAEDASFTRMSMEAYDDRENRNAAVYSIVYNMQASRQDEFGETLYPTITVSPENVGFDVTVRLMSVYNEFHRATTGSLAGYDRRNIIRAVADSTIIKNEMTRVIPVYRAQAAASFVPDTFMASHNLLLEGESIPTAPLAVGVKLDLLGLSQTDALLANGVMDMTDSLDPAIKLTNFYVKFPDTVSGQVTTPGDKFAFSTDNLPLSEFTYSTQGNYRLQTLNFDTTSIVITDTTTSIDGSALNNLASIASQHYVVRLAATLNGSSNIETGTTVVFGSSLSVFSVADASGNQLDLSSGAGLAIVNAVALAKIVGYDVRAYRTNVNRRQRGQLVDTTFYTQRFNVPLRGPVTAIRPISSNEQSDAPYIQTLISTTRIRLTNQAVTSLLNFQQTLASYFPASDSAISSTEALIDADTLGIGRFYVVPKYFYEAIDMRNIVDSLSSAARPADMQAALVNKLRDYAFQMHRDSQYQAAADVLAGGPAPIPTVIIATDPVLARYINVTGDLRTLGGGFDVRVVSSIDYRIAGKIFMTFGVFDENRNVAPNPLNFGNLAWAPELTASVQITRNGAISKETSVQPRFMFFNNLPVLTCLTVTNVPDVLDKVSLKVTNHPA